MPAYSRGLISTYLEVDHKEQHQRTANLGGKTLPPTLCVFLGLKPPQVTPWLFVFTPLLFSLNLFALIAQFWDL